VRARLSLALTALALLLAAALGGCTTTAGTSTQIGLHNGTGVDEVVYGTLAEEPSGGGIAVGQAGDSARADAALDPSAYYVEFRARAGPIFHTYMIYGPLDGAGRPLAEHFAGFHPEFGALGLLAGSAPLPVRGTLDKVWSDEHLPVLTSYRATIGPQQYRNMVAFIEQERRKQKYWNLWVYNCNNFAAEVARAAGLQAPVLTTLIPPIYVSALGAMNRGEPVPTQATVTAASWTPSAGYERRSFDN
jgi:hypothetical protein